jgi:hypothetical protein
LRVESFEPLVGKVFHLALDGQTEFYPFELVQARLSRHAKPGSKRRQAFSLLFKGPNEYAFPQSIYRVTHDTFGELKLFLVPVVLDEEGRFLEAVFN